MRVRPRHFARIGRRWPHDSGCRRQATDDQGTVIVLVAFAATIFLGLAAIALDLGNGYSSSRQVQNSADASALAAAQTLECYEFTNPASPNYYSAVANPVQVLNIPGCTATVAATQVASVATTVAQSYNGSTSTTCQIITPYDPSTPAPHYSIIADCSNTAAWALSNGSGVASGVLIGAGAVKQASFGRTVGVPTISLNRTAAATVQPLVNLPPGITMLLACGTGQANVGPAGGSAPNLLVPDSTTPSGYALNLGQVSGVTSAVYNAATQFPLYELHGPQISTCGAGADSFKGTGAAPTTPLPTWLNAGTGTTAGPTRTAIAGQPGCDPSSLSTDPQGCVLVVPICTSSQGSGSNTQLFCVAFGAFELVTQGSNYQYFGFLGPGTAITGSAGSGPPTATGVNLIQLVQ